MPLSEQDFTAKATDLWRRMKNLLVLKTIDRKVNSHELAFIDKFSWDFGKDIRATIKSDLERDEPILKILLSWVQSSTVSGIAFREPKLFPMIEIVVIQIERENNIGRPS